MEDLKDNKMFWVVVVFTIINMGCFFGGKVLVDKVAIKVIEKLQKEYSPSPYGPGLDPDRVNVEAIRQQKKYFEMKRRNAEGQNVSWRDEWEKDRGFNPEQ